MRKIIVFNMVTVDAMFPGENGDISWHNTDAEFGKFVNEQTGEFGGLIFGRVTYDLMASYWPTADAIKNDPIVANLMNSLQKIVFSKTQDKLTWENCQLYSNINLDEVQKWKEQPGKDIAIFGSGTIVQQFANLDLIDEYRLMVNPVILGQGKSLFQGVRKKKLKLLNTRTFGNGNVLLFYQPA